MMALRGEYCMAMVVAAGEHGVEGGVEFLPGGVLGFGAGEGVEAAGFDAVDQFLRARPGPG